MLLAALLVLGGCTKKEEILFLGEGIAAEQPETGDSLRKSTGKAEETAASAGVDSVTGTEEQEASAEAGLSEETVAPVQTEPHRICIHVCGAVQMPGVYELQAGSRVYEAVQAAGGFAAEADQNYVNQAQELTDGVKLVIPTVEEAAKAREGEAIAEAAESAGSKAAAQIGMIGEASFAESSGNGQTEDGTGKININTATEAQLCKIPGIGATRAAAIAAYRESHGAFQKPEDIMKVNGIKEGMYEKIKDSISVN